MKNKFLWLVLVGALLSLCGCGSIVEKRTEVLPTGETTNFFVPAPALLKSIQAAQSFNSITAPVNPYSVPIQGALAGLAGVAAWYARRKTAELSQEREITATVIQGVENAGANSEPVKAAVKYAARARGNGGAVDRRVQQIVNQ